MLFSPPCSQPLPRVWPVQPHHLHTQKKRTTGHWADLSSDGDVEGKRARHAQARRRNREIIREVRCLNSRPPLSGADMTVGSCKPVTLAALQGWCFLRDEMSPHNSRSALGGNWWTGGASRLFSSLCLHCSCSHSENCFQSKALGPVSPQEKTAL